MGREVICVQLERYLKTTPIRHVYLATGTSAPRQLAYVVHFPRISLPFRGTDVMDLEIDKKQQTIHVRQGEALVIPPNCWNKPTWEKATKTLHLLFGKKQTGITLMEWKGGTETPSSAAKAYLPGYAGGPLQDMLHALLQMREHHSACPSLVKSILLLCLDLLRAPSQPARRKALETFESLCLYVQANFSFQITRQSVADNFAITPNHVSRLFQKEGLMRFNDYVTRVRIDRAKFLLQNHELSVEQIASNCGFSETAYFCRVFKRFTKTTPTEYRLCYRR